MSGRENRCAACGGRLRRDCWWPALCVSCFDAQFPSGAHKKTRQAREQREALGLVLPFPPVERLVEVAA